MPVAVTRKTRVMLIVTTVLAATSGAPRAFASDGTLLALEDDWRRVATLTIQDQARGQGINVAVETAMFTLVPDGGATLGSASASGGSHVLYLSRQAHRLQAGLYEAVVDAAGPAGLPHFGPARAVLAAVQVQPGDPAALHTPLGDDVP